MDTMIDKGREEWDGFDCLLSPASGKYVGYQNEWWWTREKTRGALQYYVLRPMRT